MLGAMNSPQQEKNKKLLKHIDTELAGRFVSSENINTVGKTLFELSQIFLEIENSEKIRKVQ